MIVNSFLSWTTGESNADERHGTTGESTRISRTRTRIIQLQLAALAVAGRKAAHES